jgi:NADH-quinone oxidoreductase subunit M
MLNSILWTPLVFGLVGMFVPRRFVGWWATLGAALTVALAAVIALDFDPAASGLQNVVDVRWIPSLGIRYSLGIDGLNVYLVLLTAVVWLGGTAFAASRTKDRPRLFFLWMMLAETGTIGAFLAQDLLLFVLFFDLMLIPFYFLFGVWGENPKGTTAVAATTKMFIYTLVGSLLLLVGVIAAAMVADTDSLTFSMRDLQGAIAASDQSWLFWLFAAAFLVKMPAFLLHGWVRDTYRSAPLPALVVFSAVLSKVGAYGFLRTVLPILPDATVDYQEIMIILGIAAILYGSAMAFTQTNMRLIAAYSSLAQLGFILAGIFALRPDGADGAVLQMINHGIVVAPLLIIVALLVERTGSDDLSQGGALAMRAPVLAVLFLVVTMANLAIPGSANFIGEFYILNALFEVGIVYAIVASIGIAMAAYYALRLYQRTMHNRAPSDRPGVAGGQPAGKSREIGLRDGVVLGGLVACIVALALQPQIVLHKTEGATQATVSAATTPSKTKGDDSRDKEPELPKAETQLAQVEGQ